MAQEISDTDSADSRRLSTAHTLEDIAGAVTPPKLSVEFVSEPSTWASVKGRALVIV